MKFIHAQSEAEWSDKAISLFHDSFQHHACPSITFPTGRTPEPFYTSLAKQSDHSPAEFNFIMLDEYAGLDKDDPRSFSAWLARDLLDPLRVPVERRLLFNPYAQNTESELNRFRSEMSRKPSLTLAFLGVGMNGHLAMNDPPVDAESSLRVVNMDDQTYQTNESYWEQHYPNSAPLPRQAYTLGLQEILSAEKIVLLVREKQELVERIKQTNSPDKNFPVSFLHTHPNVITLSL
jgi:6-phosphogluconolactonase/glucosamine-6-phosphate isomerase/deaminase